MNILRPHFRSLLVLVLTGATVFISSCIKDKIDMDKLSKSVNINGEIVAPIATGSFSLSELLEGFDGAGLVKQYPDSLLYIVYRNTLLKNAVDTIRIPNQSFSFVSPSDPFGVVIPIVDTIPLKIPYVFSLKVDNGEEIDSIYLKKGVLSIKIQAPFNFSGEARIKFPTLTKNGIPFTSKITINNASETVLPLPSYNIAGYKLITNPTGAASNQIPVNFDVALANPHAVKTGKISFNLYIDSLEFKSLFGYFGNYELFNASGSSVKLVLFKEAGNIAFSLNNPKIVLYSSNSLGIPVEVKINNVFSQLEEGGVIKEKRPIIASEKILDYKYPKLFGDPTEEYSQTFDSTNSSVNNALTINPQYIIYDIVGKINPAGKTHTNFVTDTSHLNIDFEVQLPMDVKIGNYSKNDTLRMNVDSMLNGTDIKMIEKLLIHTKLTNSMPFQLKLQVYLVDSVYNTLDSLFTTTPQPIMSSGILDANGRVISADAKDIDISIDGDRIEKIRKMKYAILNATVATADEGKRYVKIYSNYRMKASLGVLIRLKVKSLNQFNK